MDGGLEKFKNKSIRVIYRDVNEEGRETRGIKVGKLIDYDSNFLYLLTSDSKNYILIPINIIQRIEVISNEKV
jgi:hypothetical protein